MSEHHHDHLNATHTHDGKPIQNDEPPSIEAESLETAVRELLMEKGVITADELRGAIEVQEQRRPELGAKIIARAWVDEDFKQKLLSHGDMAVRSFGVDMKPTELCVVENTEEVHNLVVCTLCSCYPRAILGIPPAWYKRRDYRSRAVREPRSVLSEFGTIISEDRQVRVHDSNADLRYLVLPRRPPGTDDWSEEDLTELITRDSMLGVSEAITPGE